MPTTMASLNLLPSLLLPLLATFFVRAFPHEVSIRTSRVEPLKCSAQITCNASLYHTSHDLNKEEIAFFYSVQVYQIKPIKRNNKEDYLIAVPCTCRNSSDLSGYFYDTTYIVKKNDTSDNISQLIYSGQAWIINGSHLNANESITIHLPCGCSESDSQIVVSYTVQPNDTPSAIANLLNSTLDNMQRMNRILAENPSFIDVGWVLFIPEELRGLPSTNNGGKNSNKWKIVIIIAGVTLLSLSVLFILILRRNRACKTSKEDSNGASKRSVANRTLSNHWKENMEDATAIESERAVIFSLEEIEEATNNFDETRRIGVGGYGSVYFGILGEKEVAVKKMRSNKSKEFYAELKVLCKIHHINIVELLGYASGEDHLYLVYEYVPNGSLSDHLHDPLLRGYQPLAWNSRVQIALDAAKGLEYIHDYTIARYVHRDIKTSNFLLDEKLRAKVADFGLAKLVERTNDEDFIATRLVGTPGYLPPESLKELQVTPKTDVFAFGVVLSELVTGKRALFRDSQEASKVKSLITVFNKIFQDDEPETALEYVIDGNLQGGYPIEDAYKMAALAEWCLREDPVNRPEMREIVVALSQLVMSSIEWEASLDGKSQVFSGLFDGR